MSTNPVCPHCGKPMDRWATPSASTWESFLYVCFNDDCPYFVRGWSFMEANFGRRASYRHSLNPDSGAEGPLPVWSKNALRGNIVPETEDDSDTGNPTS